MPPPEEQRVRDQKDRIRKRCGKCDGCQRDDCGVCVYCVRRKQVGGKGGPKQACLARRCQVLEQQKVARNKRKAGDYDDQYSDSGRKRRRTRTDTEASSSEPREKDPLVIQLEEAYPDPPSTLLADQQVLKAAAAAQHKPPPTGEHLNEFKYGQPTPPQITEMCAGCKSNNAPVNADPDREVVILLCDGPGCPHEYHLECCLPSISEIPHGAYYCIDCDPSGSSKVLTKYLDKHDDRRHKELASGGNAFNFLFSLWKQDLEENQDNWTEEKELMGCATNQSDFQRVPVSELSRLVELQHHLHGWPAGKPYSLDDLGGLLVGKPVRLYCPLDDNYHSGRIVDYRPIPPTLHPFQGGKKSSSSKTFVPTIHNTSAKTCHPNDDFFANKMEFLVRFLPGSNEYRKTIVTRWIRLEEHSLAVGTHLVWGAFPVSKKETIQGSPHGNSSAWTPSLLFLRTSREVMPVIHLLREEEGEVIFHPPTIFPKSKLSKISANHPCAEALPKRDSKKVWSLAKRLGAAKKEAPVGSEETGEEPYKLLQVASETRDLWSRKPTASHVDQLKYSLAVAEHEEQVTCQRWRNMPLMNKWHPKALIGRDEQGLGPVAFQNEPKTKEEEELCPLIRSPGLDRGHLMQRLLKRGNIDQATRDAAIGLECWLVP